jgi:transcriptional regulator with XRE-family HTH domain
MERLKQLREENKLSQSALADELSTSQSAISFYETGTREPSIDMLVAYAKYFEVSVDYLLERTGIRNTVLVSELTNSEIALLKIYAKLTASRRRRLFAYLEGLADGTEKRKADTAMSTQPK